MRLLTTKKISPHFKDRLIQHGMSLISHPFIQIESLPISISKVQPILIFTSQNAVNIAFESVEIKKQIHGKNCFCVGEKTKSLLEEKGQKVIKMCQNSSDLAQFIAKNHENDSFSFFCGKQRRPEIETILHQKKIVLAIHELYQTNLTPHHFQMHFDGVLFFSPSAVTSFFMENSWSDHMHGFCIGTTTASELAKYTPQFSTAKQPSESHLLLTIHHYYSQHYAKK